MLVCELKTLIMYESSIKKSLRSRHNKTVLDLILNILAVQQAFQYND